VSVAGRQTPEEVLTIVTSLSGVPVDTLQSPTQLRNVVQVRAAAAHLLRNHCGLPVKQVAPLLGRSDQTVCECSRKARLALVTGGRIAELIEQTSLVLYGPEPDLGASPDLETQGCDRDSSDRSANDADPSTQQVLRSIPASSLRYWRMLAGLTQPQLGARAGVARETIARIENWATCVTGGTYLPGGCAAARANGARVPASDYTRQCLRRRPGCSDDRDGSRAACSITVRANISGPLAPL
jgi:hypothetical protein